VAFEVADNLMGFPANLIDSGADVELKVESGSLLIRSSRSALRYIGSQGEVLANRDGFVDTGDLVEMRGKRYYFVGRRDGTINVGGLKVHPEEVEAVINGHPKVQMSLVKARKNRILGAVVIADVVPKCEHGGEAADTRFEELKNEILESCRRALAPYKVPAIIRFVSSLDVAPSGKLARFNA
jgi:acyl-CoA synthetase (AMP-forming)/AMP-acid ligase II